MNDNITLPRSVVEHVMYHLNRGDADAVCWADGVIKPALEQPQRKLTPQDIADSALLGNIESPFNACMHQEHCKRWKEQAEQHAVDHQRESSSENGQLITSCSTVPAGWKPVPLELTQAMLDQLRFGWSDISTSHVFDRWKRTVAAAPQPPVVGQSDNDTVPVPRSLLGAACAAISRKQDAPKVLEQLRRYTTGDLSQPAAEQPQVEQKPVAEVIESHVRAGLDGRFTAVVAGRERLSVGAEIFVHPQLQREPLTRERIRAIQHELSDTVGCSYETMARAVERAHNIGGKA